MEAYAVREFEGATETLGLIDVLCRFDQFIESVASSPRAVVERYWRTREAALLHAVPCSSTARDTERAAGQ